MPSSLALFLWFILLVALLRFDPARDSKISLALWVPVIWMFILGSRLPSQWIGERVASAAEAYQEGNPLDRTVSLILISLAIGILVSRSIRWADFFGRNWALMAFLFYAFVSVFWSDFPFVAFKRWFRDLGNYLVILVVLSDPRPIEAIRTLFRRLCYLLIPLSILLIKYYPEMARQYDEWTGTGTFSGAATSKNTLGVGCLISGLFFFWDIVSRWPERRKRRTKQIILVNAAFFAMTLWVLNLSNSATSRVCLILGCLVIATAHSRWSQRHPNFLKVLVPASFCLYLIFSLSFNVTGQLAGAVGRDPTLTDRTKIWAMLLKMHTNPLLGTGYESFWLGPRLDWIWSQSLGHINEAHNGYLEVYLNLGLIGLCLLCIFIITSYLTISMRLRKNLTFGSFGMAMWATMLFHSVTEADFRGGLLWLAFLLSAIAVRVTDKQRVRITTKFDAPIAAGKVPGLSMQTTGQSR
jgi:exopolysaccharide production protein ExoQ